MKLYIITDGEDGPMPHYCNVFFSDAEADIAIRRATGGFTFEEILLLLDEKADDELRERAERDLTCRLYDLEDLRYYEVELSDDSIRAALANPNY